MPNPKNRTQDSLGKEKVGDKIGKNKPKRKGRKGTDVVAPQKSGMGRMRGTMSQTRVRTTRAS